MKLSQVVTMSLLVSLGEFVQCGEKDYYKALGLDRSASDREIKKAFRKLALKYHPDKTSEPDAEARFMEIAEAYEVLRDPEKKRQYDSMGHNTFRFDSGFKPGNFNFEDLFHDFDDLFKDFDRMDSGHFNQHFASHRASHRANHRGHFDFGTDVKFEDLFESSPFVHTMDDFEMFGKGHESLFNSVHQGGDDGMKRGRRKARKTTRQSRQTCKTVTQKIGNTVTTYTHCS